MKMLQLFFLGLMLAGASVCGHAATRKAEGSAEVKVGTGVEKMVLQGEAKTFKVAVGAKVWVWTKVDEMADSKISIIFEKAGKPVFKQELQVPRAAYRTYAYRTFRKGDGGAWTAKVEGPDGKALGSAAFTVDME